MLPTRHPQAQFLDATRVLNRVAQIRGDVCILINRDMSYLEV